MVSRGKSSVLNALLGQEVFKTGTTHGTTVVEAAQPWEQVDRRAARASTGRRLVLVDTPGIDEVGGEVREALARDVARHADLILFVVSSDMQRVELEALSQLREAPEADHPRLQPDRPLPRRRPRPDLRQDQGRAGPQPDPARGRRDDRRAARPVSRSRSSSPTARPAIQWEHPAPVIEPLKARILDVLEREGKALVALNTLLHRGRPARGDRRAQGPHPRRRRQPADLELRAGQGGGRRR